MPAVPSTKIESLFSAVPESLWNLLNVIVICIFVFVFPTALALFFRRLVILLLYFSGQENIARGFHGRDKSILDICFIVELRFLKALAVAKTVIHF